ncbi:MAG TPA: alpha/beta hydrolase-fold protein [Acidisarcina sp.]|nr:alpha/beta hydrolase-fold protein [Acidisarcina sp.]
MKTTVLRPSCFAALVVAMFAALPVFSQQPLAPVSPEVHPDHTVTFRLLMPNAQKVSVKLETAQNLPLTKDAEGLWSVTTPVLEPDLYGYVFDVDGTLVVDPQNTSYKSNLLSPSNLLDVPGDVPQPWDRTDIPHGELHHHFYHSAVIGDDRDYFVYTPPGFDARAKTKYPVLYLLHGFSDDASGWSEVGKANFILDSLIAQGKAKPMLVVMTLGYGVPNYASHNSHNFDDPELTQHNVDKFRDALLTEVIPQVERSYKVSSDRKDRAIAGLSMGGSESLYTGLNNLDKFAWIGSFSMGGLTNGVARDNYSQIFPALSAKDADRIKLLWIACGTSDHLLDSNHKFIAWVNAQGIKPTTIETPGAHTWMVWRRNLTTFAPLLFR